MGRSETRAGQRRANPRHHLRLLADPSFARLAGGQVVSQISDAASSVALAGFLLFAGADAPSRIQLLQLVITAALPLVVAGPIAGLLSDVIPRRRLLVLGQCLRAATLATLAFVASTSRPVPTLACIALSLSLTRILYTARSAAVRHTVRRDDLVGADSLLLSMSSVSGLIGAAVGFALHSVAGLAVLIVAAGGHLVSAALFSRIDLALGGGHTREETLTVRVLEQVRAPRTRFVIVTTAWNRLLLGVLFGAIALTGTGSGGSRGTAIALAAVGVGSFLGTLLVERIGERRDHSAVAFVTFTGSAAVCSIAALSGSPMITIVGLGAAATSFQTLRICSDARVQATAQHGSGGRLFAAYDITHNLAFLTGIGAALGIVDTGSLSLVTATLVPAHLLGATTAARAMRTRKVRMRRGAREDARYVPAHDSSVHRHPLDAHRDPRDRIVGAGGDGGQHVPAHPMRARHLRGRTRGRSGADGMRPHRGAADRRVG